MSYDGGGPGEEAAFLAAALREHLGYQRELGMGGIPRDALQAARRRARALYGDSRGNPADALRSVRSELGECERCGLSKGRTNIVFGEGDPYARLMFVGEGPGADEDAQGLPFVGEAGRLLTKIVEAMQLERSEVYIANIVKCRPPNNRDPLPEEQDTCLPFLRKQIEAVSPRVIVTLGRVATNALSGDDMPIGRVRGVWHDYRGIALMPTYHPSYLLRNPGAKRETWADVQKVMERLGIPVEGTK